jgi:hypothetical protein
MGHNQPTFDQVVQDNLASGLQFAQLESLKRATYDPRLSQRHRIVLVAIIEATNGRTGMAFPGYTWLTKQTGYTEDGVSKTISELIEFGYLLRQKRAASRGGRALMHYAITGSTKEELQDAITIHIMKIRREAAAAHLQHEGWRPDWAADPTPIGRVRNEADPTPVGRVMTLPLEVGSEPNPTPVGRVNEADPTPVVPTVKKEKNIYGKLPLVDEPVEPTTKCGVFVASETAVRAVSSTTSGKTKEGNKLDPEWALPDDWRQWSKGKLRFDDRAVDKLAEDFRDFWISSDRSKPVKREWSAIWQDWSFFETFWQAFPRERRQDKATVRETFFEIINGKHKKLSRAKPEDLIEAAKRYDRGLKDRKFAKMPSTWLNKGCWEDDGNQPQADANSAENDPYEMPEYDPAWDNNPLGEDCPS